jgi:glycosyl hydrolase family 92
MYFQALLCLLVCITTHSLTSHTNWYLGMAKPVADVAGENQGGFSTDAFSITGFSHMHDSGTGGVSNSKK